MRFSTIRSICHILVKLCNDDLPFLIAMVALIIAASMAKTKSSDGLLAQDVGFVHAGSHLVAGAGGQRVVPNRT